MSERLAHPLALPALQELADREGVCRNPVVLRMTNEADGKTDLVFKACGATQAAKCPACAKAGRRLRMVQAREGWHLAEEPLPAPELNDDQAALLRTRALYEFLRQEAADKGDWVAVVDLDEAIHEAERELRHAGVRGRIPPRRGVDPLQALAWQHDDAAIPPEAAVAHEANAGESAISAAEGLSGSISAAVGDGDDEAESDTQSATGRGGRTGRRSRSTRRRQDAPDLPRLKVDARTVGRTFTSAEGKVYRPSTFLTLTLPSYGRVRDDGSPINPNTYDYRAAAWDAAHFPALLDRFFQNLRRAVGWNVQYFGAVEPQRRLSPHAHFAIRGAMPRAVIREVLAATYRQVWWPSTATVVYPETGPRPVWNQDAGGFCDPDTGEPLPTWDEALDALDDQLDGDDDQVPEHVVRFGTQYNIQGVPAGSSKADQLLGYLTKYLTKAVGACHRITTDAHADHQRRLWAELRHTPCSPRCPNWLRYGIQPMGAKDGMRAGFCRGKVHQPATLGLGGRRVLVSRLWSGKTLADHRYDTHAWLRNLLASTRRYTDDIDEEHTQTIQQARAGTAPDPLAFDRVRPGDPGVPSRAHLILRYIESRKRERAAITEAKAEYAARRDRYGPT